MIVQDLFEAPQSCPECGGVSFSDLILAEKKDACYYKVKASAKVWPSAYASGRLVQCRKKGADNYGNSKNEGVAEGKMAELEMDLEDPEITDRQFEKMYGMTRKEAREQFSQTDMWAFPEIRDPNRPLHERGVAEGNELTEEFDLIESIIDRLAEHNGVDAELIWEDLESLTDDELYVFAVTTPLMEDWQKANKQDRTDGMSRKAVNAYRRENPGSKLKTAVTTKPSKLKRGSKASKRRSSYCSRSRGQMKMHSISCAKTPDKAICKARRRWNCESIDFNLSEMDKSQTSPGRDGDIDWTKKQIHLGPEHVIKSKDVAQHALKALDKSMKKSHPHTPKTKGVAEAAKWRQGYRASGHPPGYQHKSGEIGPLGGTYDTTSNYGDEVKVPVNRYRDEPDRLADREKTKLSTSGKPLTAKNAARNLKTAIGQAKGKHGPVGVLPEQGVAEAINPDITNPAFSHQQQIGDYLYVAQYWSKGLKISAYDGKKKIGYAELMYQTAPFDDFADPKTTPKRVWLESEWTKVDPKYQRQGIMSTMYAYAKMLGNSVKPSQFRSDDAKAAWSSWRQSGDAKHLTSNEGVAEGLDQPKEAAKAIQSLQNLAMMKSALTMQQLSQAGREVIVTNAINAAKTLEQSYLQNKQQGNAIFVRALRDEIDNFMRGAPINASFPESDNASELGDLLQGKLGKVNFQQGVAEGDNEKIGGQYDPDDFDAMVQRLQKLASAGPMKTVWDPQRRVYRNVPTAQQPPKQPKK